MLLSFVPVGPSRRRPEASSFTFNRAPPLRLHRPIRMRPSDRSAGGTAAAAAAAGGARLRLARGVRCEAIQQHAAGKTRAGTAKRRKRADREARRGNIGTIM